MSSHTTLPENEMEKSNNMFIQNHNQTYDSISESEKQNHESIKEAQLCQKGFIKEISNQNTQNSIISVNFSKLAGNLMVHCIRLSFSNIHMYTSVMILDFIRLQCRQSRI